MKVLWKFIFLKIPDTYDQIIKIFQENAAPIDVASYLQEPIYHLILKYGESLLRLEEIVNSSGPLILLKEIYDCVSKYETALRLRQKEFLFFIKETRLESREQLSDSFILECMKGICLESAKLFNHQYQKKLKKIRTLSKDELKKIDIFLLKKQFVREKVTNLSWSFKSSSFCVNVDIGLESKAILIRAFDQSFNLIEYSLLGFEDFTIKFFPAFISQFFKKLKAF